MFASARHFGTFPHRTYFPGSNMSKRSSILLFLFLPLLPGCLQVELNGPVAGAEIRITLLKQGKIIATGFRSEDVASQQTFWGKAEWTGFDALTKAVLLGGVIVPDTDFVDEQYYLVTAYGGVDMDGNGNGRIDSSGVPVSREVHAIMKGSHLGEIYNRVTLLSEAIYQVLEWRSVN